MPSWAQVGGDGDPPRLAFDAGLCCEEGGLARPLPRGDCGEEGPGASAGSCWEPGCAELGRNRVSAAARRPVQKSRSVSYGSFKRIGVYRLW